MRRQEVISVETISAEKQFRILIYCDPVTRKQVDKLLRKSLGDNWKGEHLKGIDAMNSLFSELGKENIYTGIHLLPLYQALGRTLVIDFDFTQDKMKHTYALFNLQRLRQELEKSANCRLAIVAVPSNFKMNEPIPFRVISAIHILDPNVPILALMVGEWKSTAKKSVMKYLKKTPGVNKVLHIVNWNSKKNNAAVLAAINKLLTKRNSTTTGEEKGALASDTTGKFSERAHHFNPLSAQNARDGLRRISYNQPYSKQRPAPVHV